MADNLLEKASILLTPTAYNDGRMLSVKPNENLYGSELVTNGDFSNGLADWVVDDGTSWTNVNNTAFCDGNNGLIKQNITSAQNKIYKVTFDTIATNSSGKELGVRIDGGTYSWNLYPTGTHTIYLTAGSANSEGVLFYAINGWTGSIDNISVVEDLSGDFTFSRGSAATRVNAQGLVENVQIISDELVSNGDFSQEGSELITNGDFATDSDWITNDWSISGGTLNGSASTGIVFQNNIGTVVGKTYKVVLEISNYASGTIRFKVGGDSYQNIASEDGVQEFYFVAATTANNILFSVQSAYTGSIDNISVKEVGQDWTLGTGWSIAEDKAVAVSGASTKLIQSISGLSGKICKVSLTLSDYGGNGSVRVDFGSVSSDPINTNGEHTIYGTYDNNAFELFKNTGFSGSITNISVKEITDDTDLPRINYTDGCGSWLLEPQSTNLITYSEDFSQWNNYITTPTLNSATSPSGYVNAAKLTSSGAFGSLNLTISKSSSALNYTQSVFVKAVNYSIVNLISYGSSSANRAQVSFDLSDGSISSAASVNGNYTNPSESIEDYGNGWYRISLSFTSDTSVEVRPHIQFPVQMTSDDYVLLWGFQIEQQSYATSYIPTNGAIATRLADVATNSGNSTLINSTEGVLYGEILKKQDNNDDFILISLNNAASNSDANSVTIGFNSSYSFFLRVKSPSGSYTNQTIIANKNQFYKVALKYKSGDISVWIDGVEVATSTVAFSFAEVLDNLSFDFNGNGILPFYGKVKAVAVYKEALTDAQLQSLTTQ